MEFLKKNPTKFLILLKIRTYVGTYVRFYYSFFNDAELQIHTATEINFMVFICFYDLSIFLAEKNEKDLRMGTVLYRYRNVPVS